jgi:hypothetical protein
VVNTFSRWTVSLSARRFLEERTQLESELRNLVASASAAGDVQALAMAIRSRNDRLAVVTKALKAPVVNSEAQALREALQARRSDWKDVLRGQHIEAARRGGSCGWQCWIGRIHRPSIPRMATPAPPPSMM